MSKKPSYARVVQSFKIIAPTQNKTIQKKTPKMISSVKEFKTYELFPTSTPTKKQHIHKLLEQMKTTKKKVAQNRKKKIQRSSKKFPHSTTLNSTRKSKSKKQ